ncbi:hypothetical protein X975_02765, partial [Stegodyphus mimosarum]
MLINFSSSMLRRLIAGPPPPVPRACCLILIYWERTVDFQLFHVLRHSSGVFTAPRPSEFNKFESRNHRLFFSCSVKLRVNFYSLYVWIFFSKLKNQLLLPDCQASPTFLKFSFH